jgi:hypothetical protein
LEEEDQELSSSPIVAYNVFFASTGRLVREVRVIDRLLKIWPE